VTASGELGWRELELGGPEIARLGSARLRAARVALLGTLRSDGSPRISPIEPYIAEGELLIGALTWSRKAADLRRDQRCVLHSAVTDPDAGEGELKLYGFALEATQDLRGAPCQAWWLEWPPEAATVFCMRITRAAFIDWDTAEGRMTVHQWSPADGYHRASRSYP
jgi:hypothetical protein